MLDRLRHCRLKKSRIQEASSKTFLTVFLVFVMVCSAANAATFRVTTKIFEGPELEAAAKHILLFQEGLVYDFPQIESRYVTVFDSASRQVTLLDRETQVQTTLSTDNLVNITAQARAAAQTPEQQERLGLLAKVENSNKVSGYKVQFGNLEYHVTTQRPDDPAVAADFARFADVASRLNIARRLGPPPFARMTLNQHIAKLSELPLETSLIVHRGESSQEFRSTHVLEMMESIEPEDLKRIEEARGMIAVYRQVAPADFP